jgi:23S rRNA maturation mini-RNase III
VRISYCEHKMMLHTTAKNVYPVYSLIELNLWRIINGRREKVTKRRENTKYTKKRKNMEIYNSASKGLIVVLCAFIIQLQEVTL